MVSNKKRNCADGIFNCISFECRATFELCGAFATINLPHCRIVTLDDGDDDDDNERIAEHEIVPTIHLA